MKKLLLTIVCIIVAAVLFIPYDCLLYDDGGTKEYRSLICTVTDVHEMSSYSGGGGGDGTIDGIIIEIFGIEIYRNVEKNF